MDNEQTIIAVDTKWSIDRKHSDIGFKIRHLMIANVRGFFKEFDADIYTTGTDFSTARVDLWIDVASIKTGDDTRDGHLRSADFFDVQHHRQILFSSKTIEKPDKYGNHELWGELTIKGVSKNIKLNVRFGGQVIDPWGSERVGFTVTGKLNRSDWGLTWNTLQETGGVMLGDIINISCELELINKGMQKLNRGAKKATNTMLFY